MRALAAESYASALRLEPGARRRAAKLALVRQLDVPTGIGAAAACASPSPPCVGAAGVPPR